MGAHRPLEESDFVTDEKKPEIGNIWARSNPFKKKTEAPPPEAVAATPAEIDDPELAGLPKGVPILDIYDVTIQVTDPIIKIDVSVRNKGTRRADDVKVKVIGPPMLRPVTSPMMTLGDIVPKARTQNTCQYDMGDKYVDVYANFSVIVECGNGKPTNCVYTCTTGRHPMSATELLEEKERQMRKRFGRGDDKKDDKKKK